MLCAPGAFNGGLTCYVKDGILSYDYNPFEIERTQIQAKDKLPAGKAKFGVETKLAHPGAPAETTLKVNGKDVASGKMPVTAAFFFTANDGLDLGSPDSLDCFGQAPFAFGGTPGKTTI